MSAIGCNWMVCLAVWLAYGAQDFAGKIFAIWFPIMGFVAIGFQHVVANMFVIPAAIFAGYGIIWQISERCFSATRWGVRFLSASRITSHT